MGSKDLAEASSTGGKSREAGELGVPGPGDGEGGLSRAPARIAGRSCHLPVARRQSRSRSAKWLAGFPTGRPGGRGRGGPCTAAGARTSRRSRARGRRPPAGPRVPPRAACRGAPPAPGIARPAAARSPASPASPALSPPRGTVSRPGSRRRERSEGPSRSKDDGRPRRGAACAGNRNVRRAGSERSEAGGGRAVRSPGAPSQVCFSLAGWSRADDSSPPSRDDCRC